MPWTIETLHVCQDLGMSVYRARSGVCLDRTWSCANKTGSDEFVYLAARMCETIMNRLIEQFNIL